MKNCKLCRYVSLYNVYFLEFSSLVTIEDNDAEDVDSNRLIDEQNKYNENHGVCKLGIPYLAMVSGFEATPTGVCL